MKRTLLLIALLGAAAAASAQQYKWVDKNGRVQYGDSPPAGANATRLRVPSGAAAPSPAPAAPASKGPLSPAEQEAEFRKRQEAAEKDREKQAKASQEAGQKKENCALARQHLRTLESGQRVARTDEKGERHFLEDAQIAQETAKARQSVQDWCS